MSNLNQPTLPPINLDLENYFADSIVPQLFVDSELILRKFTPAAGEFFSISPGSTGRSIHSLRACIGHKSLVEHIRGVLLTERNFKKQVRTAAGRLLQMNIQPCFSKGDEEIEGVIITYLEL